MAERPVLIAVDVTAASEQALRQGLDAATRRGAPAVVVHVMPDLMRVRSLFPQLESSDALDAVTLGRRVQENIEGWLNERGVQRDAVTLRIESGEAHVRITELAVELNAALVVLGSTPRREDTAVNLGGTAERVLRHAPVPVLIARESPAKGIVVGATDLSEASEPALYAAAREAKLRGMPLTALAVVDADAELQTLSLLARYSSYAGEAMVHGFEKLVAETTKRLDALLSRLEITAERDVRTGVAATLISRHAREHGATLVVVATHGATGFSRVLVGSVAETVARSAPCSVLVVRAAS